MFLAILINSGTGIDMRLLILNIFLLFSFFAVTSVAAWGEDYLYLPQPVTRGEQDPSRKDGVLVRELVVKKRDTLSGISKKTSGKGFYYPQILLFNNIKNPHLIHPGDILRVPVASRGKASGRAAEKVSASALPLPTSGKRTEKAYVTSVSPPAKQLTVKSADTPEVSFAEQISIGYEEQSLYAKALASAKKGACRESVEMFNQFIRLYPKSALLPEATLNRAECYLNMSNQ